ncbi:hypothetical protein Taro_043619 [Colocasia esculenta]|uniref:Uncharacterized protein n=1 Tax=Colocasia esculenta TaxID=4460 RepID=A0A843WSJ6_COLES|nr:hypothetical protein [Colocasia esculenta]
MMNSCTEFYDRVVFPYRTSCGFASALPFVAAGRVPGGGDKAVGEVPIARSGFPFFPVYVTLGLTADWFSREEYEKFRQDP